MRCVRAIHCSKPTSPFAARGARPVEYRWGMALERVVPVVDVRSGVGEEAEECRVVADEKSPPPLLSA